MKNFKKNMKYGIGCSFIALFLFGFTVLNYGQIKGDSAELKLEMLKKKISEKVIKTSMELGDSLLYPRSIIQQGHWKTVPIRDWTSGFYPGILWYMFEFTKDETFADKAKKWTEGLKQLQFYSGSHDVGFLICCSFGNGYRLTKNEDYKKVILQTAKTLAQRYNEKTGSIKSWDNKKWQFPVIIDNMMNLELLFWASENGGTKQMYDIAVKHAENTMKNHFRPDGSTYHVVDYDTLKGNVISKTTHQGYADSSCWARGQAWAIYGFTMAYRFTKDARFLKTAQNAADYFITHLPQDKIPYWDFNAPSIPNEPRDASSAAIASSAFFELSRYVNEKDLKNKYYDEGLSILLSLSSPNYFSSEQDIEGLIKHSVGNKPSNVEVDASIIYGDYYFIEALLRYNKILQIK